MSKVDLASKLLEFAGNQRRELDEVRELLKKFSTRFPYRKEPGKIDRLTPSDLYEKGSRDTLFYWVEFGTFDVAHLAIWGVNIYENAKSRIEQFKPLLKVIVDEHLSIHQKIDAPWDSIRGFGGDRHIAKKMLALFYPEIVPILNTNHFEHFASKLTVDAFSEAKKAFQKDYEATSVGEKFEIYNRLFNNWRQSNAPTTDNIALAKFLYQTFPLPSPPPSKPASAGEYRAGTLGLVGHLFEPENELGVVSLFSMHHQELGFPFILSIQSAFPDAIVIDDERRPLKVEFEYRASNFIQHNHPPKGCDLIVCWENDLEASPGPEVLALKDEIPRLKKRLSSEEQG